MQIGVIVPIIHDKFINGLLACIEQNSCIPGKIIIIDNSKNDVKLKTRLDVVRHVPSIPYGVNASWNYGIHELTPQVDLISVLNDDLLIENLFFEKILMVALLCEKFGVFCPETVSDPLMIRNAMPLDSVIGSGMNRREGWAWTIRSEIAKQIPSIPEELKTWCGDDWYWHHCTKLNRPWMKMINNKCFHFVGQSNRIVDVHKDIRKEKQLFKQHL